MGRKRKANPLGLPDRVYPKHGAFYYVHRDGHWERIGVDVNEAKRKGNQYNESGSTYGTMKHFLHAFIKDCETRLKIPAEKGGLALRTVQDYTRDIQPLNDFFGHMTPTSVAPHHIQQYLDIGLKAGRGVRANRERACLSACFSYLIRFNLSGVASNPCTGIKRNRETPKARYVEHDDYEAVRTLATSQVRGLMDLIYRTLQRPEDIIQWTSANVITKIEHDGAQRRVIRTKQRKTEANVDIEITPEIDAILHSLGGGDDTKSVAGRRLIHRRDGKPYTYDGLCSMLKKYVAKANGLNTGRNARSINADRDSTHHKVTPFSFYDLKSKGATDMWLAGIPLEQIQVLCGHESITTTEIYVKCRWRGTVQPNRVVTKTAPKVQTDANA